MDQQEIELAKQTANTSLNLSFFEMDEVFKEAFEERIGDGCIYVSGQCKEETIYCVLNELRRWNTGKVIFVARKKIGKISDRRMKRIQNQEGKF